MNSIHNMSKKMSAFGQELNEYYDEAGHGYGDEYNPEDYGHEEPQSY